MFAEKGGRAVHATGGFGKPDRRAGDSHRTDIRLVHGDKHAPVADDRILADLLNVVDP